MTPADLDAIEQVAVHMGKGMSPATSQQMINRVREMTRDELMDEIAVLQYRFDSLKWLMGRIAFEQPIRPISVQEARERITRRLTAMVGDSFMINSITATTRDGAVDGYDVEWTWTPPAMPRFLDMITTAANDPKAAP